MAWTRAEAPYIELRHVVPRFLPTDEISGVDCYYMASHVLCGGLYIYGMVNLFMFLGNWDILTLLVMADIFFFIIVTLGRINVMYGVMFILVLDLVVCIYVMYL